jgi:hypothetical protein
LAQGGVREAAAGKDELRTMRIITYDLEIKRAIPSRGEPFSSAIEYCQGWHDHANMGISCIGAWDSETDSPHVFLDDNLFEFQPLINSADVLVSYNGISFDNNLLRANGFNIEDAKCYDLLAEIWKAVGLAPTFQYPSHIGYGLGDVCQLNFGRGKTGDGAKAPILFQKGKLGAVIDYCLQDVSLTKQLFDLSQSGEVLNPKNGSPLKLRNL